jgi:hypothetical protein
MTIGVSLRAVRCCLIVAGAISIASWASPAFAVVQSWHIEPQSSLKIAAKVNGLFNASPQATGGDVDSYGGTLAIDKSVQSGSTVLSFAGGSLIDAAANPAGPFVPAAGPQTGTEDNYGLKVNVILTTYRIAVRDLALDIASGTATAGQPAAVNFRILAGTASAEQSGGTPSTTPLDTTMTHVNGSTSPMTLTNNGGLERLTMPVSANDTETVSGFTVNITFTGQLVASRGKLGDYDGDGEFGAGDYALWKSTFGSRTNLAADGNGNGVVDAGDYTVWRDHSGPTGSAGSVTAVPEPSAGALIALGCVAILARRKLRRS